MTGHEAYLDEHLISFVNEQDFHCHLYHLITFQNKLQKNFYAFFSFYNTWVVGGNTVTPSVSVLFLPILAPTCMYCMLKQQIS